MLGTRQPESTVQKALKLEDPQKEAESSSSRNGLTPSFPGPLPPCHQPICTVSSPRSQAGCEVVTTRFSPKKWQ